MSTGTYADSIIINGLDYSVLTREYLEKFKASGCTAANVTVTALQNCWETMYRLGEWFRMFEQNQDLVQQVFSVEDIRKAKKEGKVALIVGFQNTSPIDDNIDLLAIYKRLGVQIMQLCYNPRNLSGDGCIEPGNAGLSDFGYRVVKEMNRVGILIDLSHVGERTTLEAIEASEKPCSFTHAGPKAKFDVPRNKTDECLKKLAAKGGVVGANAYPTFLSDKEEERTLDRFLDSIDYMVDLIGVEHVGIGTDFVEGQPPEFFCTRAGLGTFATPGTISYPVYFPKGLESVSDFENVWNGLIKRGYSVADTQAIMGGNFLRLFEEVWGS